MLASFGRYEKNKKVMEANNNKITCPKCNSQNVQSEGMIHLCMDCGYKWEDEVLTDLGEMIIYQSDEGVRLDVRLENKTVWLNQEQIGALFNKSKATISEHISNIFKEGELDEKVVVRKFRTTTQHGALEGKTQSKEVKYYNLDVIISVGCLQKVSSQNLDPSRGRLSGFYQCFG